MLALIRKEFRNQLPFFLLVLLCGFVEVLFLFIAEYPDQSPMAEEINAYESAAYAALLSLLSFALGVGLLQREFEDRTIEFLDSLPISRSKVFASKVLTALSILFIFPVFVIMHLIFAQFFSRTSLDPLFHWDVLTVMILLEWIVCFVSLSVGLILSFLKRFAWMVAAVLVWTFLVLKELDFTVLEYFNIFSLTDPVFYDQKLLIPVKHVVAQMSAALLLFGIAFLIFVHKNPDPRVGLAQFIQKRSAKFLFTAGTLIVIVLWLGWITYFEKEDPSEDLRSVQYVNWQRARAQTNHYELLYPSEISQRAKALIHAADPVYREVSRFFNQELKDRIAVDLTGEMDRHVGQAYWKKVRIDISYEQPIDQLQGVLAHETAHVFIDSMSDSKIFDKFDSTRFFHEGVATNVEYTLYRSEELHNKLRVLAAAAYSRDQVSFEELADTTKLSAKYDTDLVYPLGEVFAAVIAEQYGNAGLKNIITAFNRKDAPEDLMGMSLWQDTFQSCNYNLTESINIFMSKLEALAAENDEILSSVPRIKGAVIEEEGYVGIRPIYEGKLPVVCRFRKTKDQNEDDYVYSYEEDGVFWVDENELPGRSFWYQLGVQLKGYPAPIYEPWVEIRR